MSLTNNKEKNAHKTKRSSEQKKKKTVTNWMSPAKVRTQWNSIRLQFLVHRRLKTSSSTNIKNRKKKSRIRKQINDNTNPSSNNKDKDIHWRIQKKGSNMYIYIHLYIRLSGLHLLLAICTLVDEKRGRWKKTVKISSTKEKKKGGSLQFTRASGWKHEKKLCKADGLLHWGVQESQT